MKRDMDLIREMLLSIESFNNWKLYTQPSMRVLGYTDEDESEESYRRFLVDGSGFPWFALFLNKEGVEWGPAFKDKSNMLEGHFALLIEKGYLTANLEDLGTGYLRNYRGLSWEGHDLLDRIRDEGVGRKTKDLLRSKGLQTVGIEIVKTAANQVAKLMLNS